ncbi:uncharacterized protein LOC100831746 [Brachypodium distachyon]|uniref:Uncharacterized protein n=1 Tax=Brachypodium distachyon TaxID=15368 RepID=A0A0Q3FEP3_BRADI|nr:uncharacterized protein LOC100831746 [Brachypodium distachyon]KQJ96652.1 hypothetical protein BRADI_3g26377v3 [Brachypodium distachyon]|eukprot:XP_003571775.2 uncharacterized protein LOC100831746 [Brachypodium distachyon]
MEGQAAAAAMSELQLQLLALVSDLRLTRERERAAREEIHAASQRWKEAEEEQQRETRELRTEVSARDEALRRLESRVKCLENENELLGRNEKDLKESMERLLQSRETFMKHYEDSACSLQWTIQLKDKQIAVISEKLNSHLALFSSVGKEVAAVKQALGDVECLVCEKENIVSDLKGKVQRISVLEKDFVEKLSFLGDKITSYQLELRNRARIIYELKGQLDAEKLNNNFHPQLEELTKALLVKDEIIERLTKDKQAMLMELHNMEIALRNFQDIISNIGHQGAKRFSPVSESQEIQDNVSKELESIPGSEGDPRNGHKMVPVIDEAEYKLEIGTVRKEVQSPVLLKHSALPSPEPGTANAETPNCLGESEDFGMGDSSPAQRSDNVNRDIETGNQS